MGLLYDLPLLLLLLPFPLTVSCLTCRLSCARLGVDSQEPDMSDVWDISSADTPGGDMDIRTNSGVAPDIAGACVDGIDDGDTAEVVVAIELSKAAG